ncbi:hypothetical protein EYZ11_007114 [Aspergillus tanneri]|uniref:Uncharacterized protein n=1 Tax=Aspergillus tanneri TaxID=1220188 RepID=A0A4S3JDT6_9EURO|nr:hypothetical protein EYZ11_007114 [Aspergillus tanneri]
MARIWLEVTPTPYV